jgi:hypothetical protein
MYRGLMLGCVALCLASLAGCAPSLESKLIGRWQVDTQGLDLKKIADEKIKEQTAGNEMAAAMAQAFAGMMESMLQSLSVEMDFRPDHTVHSKVSMNVMGQNQEKVESGTWKVEVAGDNQLTVLVTTSDGKTNRVNIQFVDDNRFTATGSVPGAGDQQVTFNRLVETPGA